MNLKFTDEEEKTYLFRFIANLAEQRVLKLKVLFFKFVERRNSYIVIQLNQTFTSFE